MAKQVNVCSDWHGSAQENFTWINQNTLPVTVTQLPNSTWPFSLASGFSVPGKGVGGPGQLNCSLLNLPNNTYPYNVDGCITGGQAKNVTIP
jgi:hypothetical protein